MDFWREGVLVGTGIGVGIGFGLWIGRLSACSELGAGSDASTDKAQGQAPVDKVQVPVRATTPARQAVFPFALHFRKVLGAKSRAELPVCVEPEPVERATTLPAAVVQH